MSYGLRRNASIALVIFCAAVAAIVWGLDPVSQQNEIGILLGAELVGFSLIAYLYTRPSDSSVSEFWLLLGILTIAFLIGMATL
ncbi:MAG: hypothetical protein QXV32_09005 [Conexivisphaerales archaeon]